MYFLVEQGFFWIAQTTNRISKQDCFLGIMGYEQRSSRTLLPKTYEGIEQSNLELDVQALKRFVQKHQLRRMGESTGDCHPLAHTSRKLGGIQAGAVRQADHLKIMQYDRFALRPEAGAVLGKGS